MSNSHLPPIASDAVFSVSASSLIDAPRDKVWSILLDFGSYKTWNSFARGQTIVDASKNPLLNQTPKEGQYIFISPIHLPPTMDEPGLFGKSSVLGIITTLDHENYRVAWGAIGMPAFLLRTERWQALSVDEASGKTKYETIEAFNGWFAYLVKFFVGSKLLAGFRAMAEGLKSHAERV